MMILIVEMKIMLLMNSTFDDIDEKITKQIAKVQNCPDITIK